MLVTDPVSINGNAVRLVQPSQVESKLVAALVSNVGNVPVMLLQLINARPQFVTALVSGRFVRAAGSKSSCVQSRNISYIVVGASVEVPPHCSTRTRSFR